MSNVTIFTLCGYYCRLSARSYSGCDKFKSTVDKIHHLLQHPAARNDHNDSDHHKFRHKGHRLLVYGGSGLNNGDEQTDQNAHEQDRSPDLQAGNDCISENF